MTGGITFNQQVDTKTWLTFRHPEMTETLVDTSSATGTYYAVAEHDAVLFEINYPQPGRVRNPKNGWLTYINYGFPEISLKVRQLDSVGALTNYYTTIEFPWDNNPGGANKSISLAYVNTTKGSSSCPVYALGSGEIAAITAVGIAYGGTGATTAAAALTNLGVTGLVSVAATQPTEDKYSLWVDTSEDAADAMRADAIKYKTFSIATSAWSGSGPYTYTMTAAGITENSAILNLTLDAASQSYQKAQLDWETKAGQIILSTSTKPTGTISGYLIATEVTVI